MRPVTALWFAGWSLNYGARAARPLTLRNGVQYVINPSGEKTIPNALGWDLQGVGTF